MASGGPRPPRLTFPGENHLMEKPKLPPLLTFNCHEAWVHQLEYLARPVHIVDGLPGRYTQRWDEQIRPIPAHATLITLDDALRRTEPYDCIIAHNVSDLMTVKTLAAPRLFVIHGTIEGRMDQEGLEERPAAFLESVRRYVDLLNIHVVAVSALKGDSWGIPHEVIPFGADPDRYPPWNGHIESGIRVASNVHRRARVLKWALHEESFRDVPVRIVGLNPDLPGVIPSAGWEDLKQLLASHRFYVHTADPRMEDGYNMATLEAMAAGLPVIGNRHPSSPVEHGVSGFLSDDPAELRECAVRLLRDRELARRMGAEARRTVQERFSLGRFATAFSAAIETARSGGVRISV